MQEERDIWCVLSGGEPIGFAYGHDKFGAIDLLGRVERNNLDGTTTTMAADDAVKTSWRRVPVDLRPPTFRRSDLVGSVDGRKIIFAGAEFSMAAKGEENPVPDSERLAPEPTVVDQAALDNARSIRAAAAGPPA